MGSGVTEIQYYAFSSCTSLTNVIIGENVNNIEHRVFANCTSLTSVTISDSVTSIAYGMFYQCFNLTNVHYSGTVEEWDAVIKENGWKVQTYITEVVCSDGVAPLT
jgi:hypothetical protein